MWWLRSTPFSMKHFYAHTTHKSVLCVFALGEAYVMMRVCACMQTFVRIVTFDLMTLSLSLVRIFSCSFSIPNKILSIAHSLNSFNTDSYACACACACLCCMAAAPQKKYVWCCVLKIFKNCTFYLLFGVLCCRGVQARERKRI